MRFAKSLKVLAVIALLIVISVPTLFVLALTINQHFANYSLGGQQEKYAEFRENLPMTQHSYNFTVSTLLHDAGGSTCNFCKIKVTAKRQGFLNLFYEEASNTTATPTTGYYNGSDFGHIEPGNFRYYIKNDGALQNNGTLRVNVSD